tara:strand:+ start:884 stop:1249 length:366 start_codon:yes stop_codon:yes gene_type:complete
MAQFLKVEALAAGQAVTLIPIAEIAGLAASSDATDTTLVITMRTGTPGTYTVVVADPLGGLNSMLKAFNDAITANPGGVVSTVVPPLTTAQAPLAQSGQEGRILITAQAVYTQFASCTYVA